MHFVRKCVQLTSPASSSSSLCAFIAAAGAGPVGRGHRQMTHAPPKTRRVPKSSVDDGIAPTLLPRWVVTRGVEREIGREALGTT